MKSNSLLSVCLAVLMMPLMSQENLFRNAGFASKSFWALIGKNILTENAGEMKLTLARERKEFTDGGIGQRIQQPKEGYYNVSVEFQSEGVNTLVFWNQISLKSGKYQYRIRTVPLKGDVTQFRKENFTFDLPKDTAWVYVQITGRTAPAEKNAVITVRNPVFKSVPAPAAPKAAAPKAAPAKIRTEVGKYLPVVTESIPAGHPRLFYSPELLSRMKKAAKDPEIAPYIDIMKKNVLDQYPKLLKYYESDDGLGPNEPLSRRYHPLENWGSTAAKSAILYRLTGEKKWADMAIDLMKKLTTWYNKRFDVNRAVSWYGWGRIHTLMAWDWLYDVMDKADRDEIAKEMISHAKRLDNYAFIAKLSPLGEGLNSPGSGFYSARCMLPWYLGIAFRNEGYDDKFADEQLRKGLDGHLQMLANRNAMAGDDGGSINSTPAYCYGTYNYVEFYFFISYQALTGKNIASDFPNMGLFPFWLAYTLFKGIDGRFYDFGTGGAWHQHNIFVAESPYHSLYRNFYSGPLCDVSDEIHKNRPWKGWTLEYHLLYRSPFFLFFKNCDLKNVKDNSAFYRKLPKGYFFENLGQVYMHSGRDTTSTRAMFTCGAKSPSHKECDENNFVIYKGGFLALDSGTRTFDFSSKGRELYYDHDSNYKSQSVSHNVVLIRMEGEKFKGWRIDPKKVGNHEGMNKTTGGIVRAFETNDDFTYVAGDSTACYNPGKAKQVVRQFLMVYPDVFVIYDTVKSVKADQKKTWLLHTQEEPVIKGDTFEVVQREGRLICRTLLPADASLEKIGGPGKEFWSDGKNHHPGDFLKKSIADSRKAGYDAPLWGHWRMEIRNSKAVADETFLHVIQVGLKKDFQKMIETKLIREGNMDGVVFRYNDVDYTITFDRSKVPAGHIRAVKNGKVLYDRDFTAKIQPQRAADYLK